MWYLDAEEAELACSMRAAKYLEGEVNNNYDFKQDRNENKIQFVNAEDKDIINIYGPALDVWLNSK